GVGRSRGWFTRVSRGMGLLSAGLLIHDVYSGIRRIVDAPAGKRAEVIGEEVGGLAGGLGGYMLGGALAAAVLSGPAWVVVAGVIVIGGTVALLGEMLGRCIGGFIGKLFGGPGPMSRYKEYLEKRRKDEAAQAKRRETKKTAPNRPEGGTVRPPYTGMTPEERQKLQVRRVIVMPKI